MENGRRFRTKEIPNNKFLLHSAKKTKTKFKFKMEYMFFILYFKTGRGNHRSYHIEMHNLPRVLPN